MLVDPELNRQGSDLILYHLVLYCTVLYLYARQDNISCSLERKLLLPFCDGEAAIVWNRPAQKEHFILTASKATSQQFAQKRNSVVYWRCYPSSSTSLGLGTVIFIKEQEGKRSSI